MSGSGPHATRISAISWARPCERSPKTSSQAGFTSSPGAVSWIRTSSCGSGLIKRDGEHTFVRGYEAETAMAMQGIPDHVAKAREFRGFVMQLEDGVGATVTRRNGMTASFNYLSRVTSFQNNFWVGYVARTLRENSSSTRMTRLVYEHLAQGHRAHPAWRRAQRLVQHRRPDAVPSTPVAAG